MRSAAKSLISYEPKGKGFTGEFVDALVNYSNVKDAFLKTIGEKRQAVIKDVKVRMYTYYIVAVFFPFRNVLQRRITERICWTLDLT